MTRFNFILLFLLCSFAAQSQNLLQAKYVRAIDSFRLKHIVDSISIDTAFSAASNRKLATAAAIKAYVDNRVGGGGAGTDLSFTGATSPITLNSSTGTDVVFAEGSNVTLTQAGGTLTIAATGGSASPAGSDTQVQFNDSGAFGADTTFSYNKTTNTLTLGHATEAGFLAFGDTSSTLPLVTVNGVRFIHTMPEASATPGIFFGLGAGPSGAPGGLMRANVGVGSGAGAALTTGGEYNTFFGTLAGNKVTTGDYNISIGYASLSNATTTSSCIAIGGNALDGTAPGNDNVAIGLGAMGGTSQTGIRNIAIGTNSLDAATSANNNFGFGYNALGSATTGGANICIGNESGSAITTGTNNVMIGLAAGGTGTYNGGSSVFLGYFAGSAETSSNRLYIENSNSTTPLIGGDFNFNRVGINTAIGSLPATLNVTGSGATSSTYSLIVTNSSAATATATLVVRDDLRVGIGTNAPAVSLDAGANTDGIELPTGTTAQRVANDNTIRSNTDVDGLEFRYNAHWNRLTSEATPSISAGAAAGTGPTISVGAGSNDLAGTIVLTTGTSATTGAICTVTFAQGLDAGLGTFVVLENGNENASGVTRWISSSGNTSFTVSTNTTLSDATQYTWHYHVKQ